MGYTNDPSGFSCSFSVMVVGGLGMGGCGLCAAVALAAALRFGRRASMQHGPQSLIVCLST